MSEQVIRASELAQYAFCAHAWWLGAVEGRPSAHQRELKAGEVTHRRHGRKVRASVALTRLAYLLLALAVLVALAALLR